MKSSIRQPGGVRLAGRKAVTALAFASLISGLSITSALAEQNNQHDNRSQRASHNDHYQNESRNHRRVYREPPPVRRPYYYAQPVYVPPPVYYEPQQSPGISLFFPLDFRR
jgi:hypothetical protein